MNGNDVSKLDDHIGFWLRCLSNFVSHSFAEKLSKEGVTVAQWVVLRTLYDHQNITLSHLAELVGLDKSSVSRMVERLVLRQLVNRSEGSDRRSLGLSLTPAARKLVPKLARLADQNDESFFNSLSAGQSHEFLATIKQLLDANGWKKSERGRDGIE
ncbi:MAG TPA: MarR family transcriptional regulator [Verrucomicrobiae bacterium]|jgi:DNA-binding MarR family transcriptional regulator|nr:MarR family transcriptional regulator [Verrucomicrobiae bacterium]